MQKFIGQPNIKLQALKTIETSDLTFQENIKSEKIKFSLFLLQEYCRYLEVENRHCLNRFQRQTFVFILKTLNICDENILKNLDWSLEILELWRQDEDLTNYFNKNKTYKLNIYRFIFYRLRNKSTSVNNIEKRLANFQIYKLCKILENEDNEEFKYLYREIKNMLEYSKGKKINLPK
jgi:hypothetical protein